VVLLAERGAGVDHPSAAANIAALVEAVAGRPGRRVLNAADPDAPSALEISRAIARHMGHEWDEALLDADDASGLGHTPWDRHPPIVLDMSTAGELGYRAVGTYAETATEEIDWLRAIAVPGSDGVRLPDDWGHHGFFDGRFDYAAEDEYLARRAG
jgi:hypothetical protein